MALWPERAGKWISLVTAALMIIAASIVKRLTPKAGEWPTKYSVEGLAGIGNTHVL
jgi:hypothetical protein